MKLWPQIVSLLWQCTLQSNVVRGVFHKLNELFYYTDEESHREEISHWQPFRMISITQKGEWFVARIHRECDCRRETFKQMHLSTRDLFSLRTPSSLGGLPLLFLVHPSGALSSEVGRLHLVALNVIPSQMLISSEGSPHSVFVVSLIFFRFAYTEGNELSLILDISSSMSPPSGSELKPSTELHVPIPHSISQSSPIVASCWPSNSHCSRATTIFPPQSPNSQPQPSKMGCCKQGATVPW